MINHPFVGSLKEKTLEELQESISSLNKKISFVSRMNNQHVLNQLLLALNSYKEEYAHRQSELWNKKSNDLGNKIDIN